MEIRNPARGTVLSDDFREAKTFGESSKGLLGEERPAALFLKTRWGIHTFGMRFPIDCVVLDEHFVVKAVCEELKPGRFFFWPLRYRNVLELPAGTVSKSGTRVGDKLDFIREDLR